MSRRYREGPIKPAFTEAEARALYRLALTGSCDKHPKLKHHRSREVAGTALAKLGGAIAMYEIDKRKTG